MLAQDVLARGAWLFPELNGVPYNNKPPLQVWLIALASWPAGHVTQLTAALPSAVAAVGTALVVFAMGRSLFGVAAGQLAALVTITTQGWFLHTRLPMPDMLMTFFITAAVAMLLPIVAGRTGPWWLGFWGAMAGAFWAKGAAALLPLAVAVAWGVVFRRPGWWHALRLPVGLALFAALIAPWWIGKLVTQTGGMRDAVVSDNLLWYVPRSFAVLTGPPQHLVGILFPWVLVLPPAVWQAVAAVRRRASERETLRFVIAWAVTLLACVGIVHQQRLRYYLPLVPPVALLIGWWAARRAGGERAERRMPWRVYAAAAAVLALATAVAALARPTWSEARHLALPTSAVEVGVMATGLVVMLTALVFGARSRRLRQVFPVACLGGAAWVIGWYHWELERSNAAYNYPRVRAEVLRLLPEAPVVATWGVYDLPLSFYLGRRVLPVQTLGDLDRVMATHPRGSAVLSQAALAGVADRGHLRVVPLDELNFHPIVLVTPRAGSQP
jgi:4-amino-4-deoxy-L-arabinose transferase-like glycosyltransferase